MLNAFLTSLSLMTSLAFASPAASLEGLYTGSLPDEGRTLYMSFRIAKVSETDDALKGSFVVGTGPDFATVDFASLSYDAIAATVSGSGETLFHGRKLTVALNCAIHDEKTLKCSTIDNGVASEAFTLARR